MRQYFWSHTVCMLCTASFECLNIAFVESTNVINICLILLTIYIFIHASGCVGRGPSALLFPGTYDAVKTAMHLYIPQVRGFSTLITYCLSGI